jgi:hypothetical protein
MEITTDTYPLTLYFTTPVNTGSHRRFMSLRRAPAMKQSQQVGVSVSGQAEHLTPTVTSPSLFTLTLTLSRRGRGIIRFSLPWSTILPREGFEQEGAHTPSSLPNLRFGRVEVGGGVYCGKAFSGLIDRKADGQTSLPEIIEGGHHYSTPA